MCPSGGEARNGCLLKQGGGLHPRLRIGAVLLAAGLVELIDAFKKRPAGHVVVPIVDGARGNPIVLDATARARILEGDVDCACRRFTERHSELVHRHETRNTRFITDLDTVEDVRQLAERTGRRLELPSSEVAA